MRGVDGHDRDFFRPKRGSFVEIRAATPLPVNKGPACREGAAEWLVASGYADAVSAVPCFFAFEPLRPLDASVFVFCELRLFITSSEALS